MAGQLSARVGSAMAGNIDTAHTAGLIVLGAFGVLILLRRNFRSVNVTLG